MVGCRPRPGGLGAGVSRGIQGQSPGMGLGGRSP